MSPTRTPSASPTAQEILSSDEHFAIVQRQHDPDLHLFSGYFGTKERITDIPLSLGIPEHGPQFDTLSIIPFNQIRERGYTARDDGTRIKCLRIQQDLRLSMQELMALLPSDPITLQGPVQYDRSDDEYADVVGQVIRDEIGRGEGANFVIARKAEGRIEDFSRAKALSIFRSLVEREFGSYMSFIVFDGKRYLIGASPERNLSIEQGIHRITSISGTLRKQLLDVPMAEVAQALSGFLHDPKEIHELFMVLDEDLKATMRMCPEGGRIEGPFLREMSRVIHTEYDLVGHGNGDVLRSLLSSLPRATVTGAPGASACRVIARYEPEGRRYYASAIALVGRDAAGRDMLDSAVTIRTVEIAHGGSFRMQAGSTIVRDSQPSEEARETTAKLSALTSILQGTAPEPTAPVLPRLNADVVGEELRYRNRALSRFFLENQLQNDLTVEELQGRRVTIVDCEDDFCHSLAHMIGRMGASVTICSYAHFDTEQDRSDIVFMGPGPGNPDNEKDPKMQKLHGIARSLLDGKRRVLGICLGHQILCRALGMQLAPRPDVHQGVQRDVDLFGTQRKAGFYNTFAARTNPSSPEISAVRDINGYVDAVRTERVGGFQFHPESILTPEGFNILRDELVRLIESLPKKPLLVERMPSGFLQIKTNPLNNPKLLPGEVFAENEFLSTDSTLQRVHAYLRYVLEGMRGRPICPFVQQVEDQNDYHVTICDEPPDTVSFPIIIQALEAEFKRLSPQETSREQAMDPMTTVAAFAHPDAHAEAFYKSLEEARNAARQRFLDHGLMIAHMHPFHTLGGNSSRREQPGTNPLYRSRIPLLMVRRMHSADHVFMKKPEEIAAYERFFGPIPRQP